VEQISILLLILSENWTAFHNLHLLHSAELRINNAMTLMYQDLPYWSALATDVLLHNQKANVPRGDSPMKENEVMRLEGVLLSHDAQVLCVMNQVLDNFEIETEVCTESDSALDAVSSRKLDTLIVDWNGGDQPAEVLSAIRKSQDNAKSTVLVMVDGTPDMQAATRAGANFIMHKPINFEQATRCLRAAYGTMLQQRRRAARYAVDVPVTLNIVGGGQVEGKITDLSVGGLAFYSKQALQVGQQVSFGFKLAGSSTLIHITGKVVNTDGKNRAGICFTFVPPSEFTVLKQWLSTRIAKLMDQQVFADYANRLN